MNLAWGRLAVGPSALGLLGLLARSPGGEGPIRFVDVTEEVGLTFQHEASPTAQKYLPETMAPGVALFDADGDGRLDVFFVNGARIRDPMPAGAAPVKDGPRCWHRFYRQKEDGRFEDATETAGLTGVGYGMGVAVGDYDNDGDADLYVTALGGNRLYRNSDRGRFQDVTEDAGVTASGWSTSAAFVDFDHDGRLDLFVCRYLDWSFDRNPYCGAPSPGPRAYCHPDQFPGITNLLYRNEGDGRFADVSLRTGVANPEGKSLGVALADYDADGLTDLFVANDSVRQFLYRNLGGGRFEDVALRVGAGFDQDGRAFAGMGVDFADYDDDGRPDVVVTNLSNQRYALYRNAGDGTFSYETFASGLGALTLLSSGWGVRFLDYDNDGGRDLLVAQGHVLDTIEQTSPHIRYRQSPLLARNEQGRFRDVSSVSGEVFRGAWAARGLATGDLDGDGDQDAVVTTVGGRAYVLRNEGRAGHFLRLRLVGRLSNRDGIGAEIRLVTAAGTVAHATVTRSGSYLSASEPVAHFGLGPEREARTIDIRWPSGMVQRLRDVAADQVLTVDEPEAPPRSEAARRVDRSMYDRRSMRSTLLLVALASLAAGSVLAEEASTAVVPDRVTPLFNGKDISGWEADVPARDQDKNAASSFVVRNRRLVSLGKPEGHLLTKQAYRDYRLEVEYRFPGKGGNCGILVHASRSRALYQMFPQSIEVQMNSGDAGDFWCIQENIEVPDMETRRPRKGGEKWGGAEGDARRILNLTDGSEKPLGQWNTMVIEARGRSVTVWVNGDKVNDGFGSTADQGKIAIQAEGTEVEFRRVEIGPLPPAAR